MSKLFNPRMPEIQPVEAGALADAGAVWLSIPEHVRVQLQLQELEKREAVVADGSRKPVSYVPNSWNMRQ